VKTKTIQQPRKNPYLVAAVAQSGMSNYDVAKTLGLRADIFSGIVNGKRFPSRALARDIDALLKPHAKAMGLKGLHLTIV